MAALTCIDARLNPLIPEVLGIPEELFIWLRNAGNIIFDSLSSMTRTLALACAIKGGKEIAIIGHTDLAMTRLQKESPVMENLRRVQDAATRAADLAKQMLAYSGKGRFVVEPIGLNDVVRDTLADVDVVRHPLVQDIVRAYDKAGNVLTATENQSASAASETCSR